MAPLEFSELIPQITDLLACTDDTERMPEAILAFMRAVTPGTHGYLWLFRPGQKAVPIFRPSKDPLHPEDWIAEVDGMYALDPWFIAHQDESRRCVSIREVMPPGFDQTNYFQRAYTSRGYVDELIHMTALPDGSTMMAGLVSPTQRGPFTLEDLERHERIDPLVATCMNRCRKLASTPPAQEDRSLTRSVLRALERFGAGELTERQAEVVQLVLRGHNSESIAAQLSISPATVKLHRRHAYSKLRVGSQGELFFKFLETLEPID